MFHYLLRFRRLLATAFLVVFTNVFVGQCWCATFNSKPGIAKSMAKGHCETEATPKPTHPGCHGHGPAQAGASDHHKTGSPVKKSSRTHDCCRDKSASVLSSLTTPAEKQLLLAPALLPVAPEFHFPIYTRGRWDRTAAVRLVPPRHLPPKIPDIRIFLRSLTV